MKKEAHLRSSLFRTGRIWLQVWVALSMLLASCATPGVPAQPSAPPEALPQAPARPSAISFQDVQVSQVKSPAGPIPPEPSPDFALPDGPEDKPEVTAKRTATSATFDMGDGLYALVEGIHPLHYQDEDGDWQRINPAFAPVEGGWANTANALHTGLSRRGGRASVSQEQTGLIWAPRRLEVAGAAGPAALWTEVLNEAQAVTGTLSADGRMVSYPSSWSNPAVQERWASDYGQAEYSLRLSSPPQSPPPGGRGYLDLRVSLRLLPGTQLHVNGAPVTAEALPLETDGALTFVGEAGQALSLQPPQAYEEDDPAERVAGRYRLEAGDNDATLELAARIPYDWLSAPQRQFPVVLDPVFRVRWHTKALVASYDNPVAPSTEGTWDDWLSTEPDIGLGQYSAGPTQALVKFNLPTMPLLATITSASLRVLPKAGTIPCNHIVGSTHCGKRSADRAGLTANVEVFGLDIASPTWWDAPDHTTFKPGVSYGVKPVTWSSDGGQVTSWDITSLVKDWRSAGHLYNKGLLLKLEKEYCYKDQTFSSGGGLGGSSSDMTYRSFPEGCGWFLFDNPPIYATSKTRPGSGIWLVVEYTAQALNVGNVVTLPSDDPLYINNPSGLPSDGLEFFGADHEYQLSALTAEWRVVTVRGLGAKIVDPDSPPEHLELTQPLQSRLGMEMLDGGVLIPATTYPQSVAYMALDGPAHVGNTPQLRLQNATDLVPPSFYDVWLSPQKGSAVVTDPGADGDSQSVSYSFKSSRPAAIFNVQMPANAINRVDVTIVRDNVEGNEETDPEYIDFYYQKYAGNFSATLFKSGGAVARPRAPATGEPADAGDSAVSPSEDFPLVMTFYPDPAAGDVYGLVVAYDGPTVRMNECISWDTPIELPDSCKTWDLFELEFSVQVRVTSCPNGQFPRSNGTCQVMRCPDDTFDKAANYKEQGGLGLWSASGWNGTASVEGEAVFIGPPRVDGEHQPPTIVAPLSKITYNGDAVSVEKDSGSGGPVVALVNCGSFASPNNPISDAYMEIVYQSAMSRQLIADEGNKAGLSATHADRVEGSKLYAVWPGIKDVSLPLSENQLYILPNGGDGQSRVKAATHYAPRLESGTASAPVKVKWWHDYRGWSSFGSSAVYDGVADEISMAGLTLKVGSAFSMDVQPAAGDVPPQFVALRASAATISQPDELGGASLPIQALILPQGVQVEGGAECAANYNCVDLRALEDAYPSPVKRTWQMPDIHTNGNAGLVMLSRPGKLQAWSVDHPAMANSPQAESGEFSFDTSGASVKVTREKCGTERDVTVVRGETQISLPMVGDDGASSKAMIAARFKLCSTPDTKLRMVEFEFHSPVGVPVGATGLFVNGLKGTVEVNPGYTTIQFGMDFYYGDPNTLQGTGRVTIDTRGMFEFQGEGKILGEINADGRLWVAWDPLDTGFEMHLGYALGDVASIDGSVRAHAWRGQGWQNKYAWLPNDPSENHFAAQISASFAIYSGAVIDTFPLVIPPGTVRLNIEIAFGQFCTNSSCSTYEWGVKAALTVCDYTVGVYYGFGNGVSVILGNDGHSLIDQFGGAYAYSTAGSSSSLSERFPSAPLGGSGVPNLFGVTPLGGQKSPQQVGDSLSPGMRFQAAPQAVNGEVTMPVTVTADTEEVLVGLGWQAGSPTLKLYEPNGTTEIVSGAKYDVVISETTVTDEALGETHVKLIGVQIRHPGTAGIWKAIVGNVEESGESPNHFKFIFLANKGAPGTPGDRGSFTAPGDDEVDGSGSYTIRWEILPDAPVSTTISLYYDRMYKVSVHGQIGYKAVPTTTDMPIALGLNYRAGSYTWDTTTLKAICPQSALADKRCYYEVRAVVDDGVNAFPEGSVSDSGDYCEPCSALPSEHAFDPNRFPGFSTFESHGKIWVTDSTPPSKPTGLSLTGTDSAIMAEWNPNPTTEKDLAAYRVEWGAVDKLVGCSWAGGASTHVERVPATLMPTLRIGGLNNDLSLSWSYGVAVSAIDINGNVSSSTCKNGRPNGSAGARIPAAPLTPMLKADASTSTSVSLGWSSQSPVDHYRLTYRQIMTFAAVMQVDNITPQTGAEWSTGAAVLTGLKPGKTYEAWVTAANSDGWHSPYSPPVTFTVSNGVNADGSSAPDDWEAAYGVVAMYNNDSDWDGLTNSKEYRAGTHPRRQDSDGDGFSDKEEVDAGADPLHAASFPAAYTQPRLALARQRVDFYAKKGLADSLFQEVNFYNHGGGTLALGASDNADWLNAIVETGVGKNYIRLYATFADLAPGVYDATVYVSGASGVLIGGTQCIRVRLHLLRADNDIPTPPKRLYLPMVGRNFGEWDVFATDTAGDVGAHTSTAMDPRSDLPAVSYYDTANKDLRLASSFPLGSDNCGPDQDWWCQTVKDAGDVGKYNSIAMWYGGGVWKLGIAYYNASSSSLEYAEYTDPGKTWTFTVIDAGDALNQLQTGLYTSLKFDAAGAPHIAYYRNILITGNHDSLRYARYVGGGAGNCGDTQWQCDLIESGDGVGRHAALDLDEAGRPHIAYYSGASDTLRYAHAVESGGNCGPSDAWRCDLIDSAVTPDGNQRSISLRVVSSTMVNVAYAAVVNTQTVLKYAYTYAGLSGSCGPNNTWACAQIVENVGGVALAATSDYTLIAYHDAAAGTLNVARRASSSLEPANCGPQVGVMKSWVCRAVGIGARGPALSHDVGQYPSMALYANGLAAIAAQDVTDNDLVLAVQQYRRYDFRSIGLSFDQPTAP